MRSRLALTALALLACAPPPPVPALGSVRVALEASADGAWDWNADQRRELAGYLDVTLDALGADFQLVEVARADVLVRAAHLDDGACGHFRTDRLGYVEVDAVCAQGFLATQRAAGHELAHWLTYTRWGWVGHLCEWPINVAPPPGCHPTRRCADCLLSPGLAAMDVDGPTTSEAYVPPTAEPSPSAVDRELVLACHAAGRCE